MAVIVGDRLGGVKVQEGTRSYRSLPLRREGQSPSHGEYGRSGAGWGEGSHAGERWLRVLRRGENVLMRMPLAALVLVLAAGGSAAQEDMPPPWPGGGLFFDAMPVLREGRIIVPLRPVIEWANGRVVYDRGHVAAYEQGATQPRLELVVGVPQAQLSGVPYVLDFAPEIRDGRLFGPLRFVAESFGVWVEPQGSIVTLRLPQLNREARMAIPPEPGSHHEKIWAQLGVYYGIPTPSAVDLQALPHWRLFSTQRQRELLAEVGVSAPTLIESHWGGRPVLGLRILSDVVDEGAGAATVQVMVKYADGAIYEEGFGFVLEPEGWRIRRQSSAQRE